MFARFFVSLVLIFSLMISAGTSNSWAYLLSGKAPEGDPSVFDYGFKGMILGSLTGLSAGYIRYAKEEKNSENIAKSTGYGLLTGAGLGLVAGIADLGRGRKGMGDIILRDMTLGGWFGLTVGTLFGGVSTISNGDWHNVGSGASWGYISGVVFGLGIALYEGPRAVKEYSSSKDKFIPSLAFFKDSQANIVTGMQLVYKY